MFNKSNGFQVMNYSHIKSLLNDWSSFINERQSSYEALLSDTSLKHLINEHNATIRKADRSNSFTVFEIISNLYYRENFHSDLISFFLDPSQNHGMTLLGIEALINLIVKQTGWEICVKDYKGATVVREEGRIDIIIRDDYSKHAILVENKMNNAGDMDRQIPRYCDILEKQGFTIDSAIYLPMLKYKTPDKSTWKERDFRWLSKIVVIPAVSDAHELSLTKDWLEPLAVQCKNEDVASTLRQYSYLITKLSNYNMDKIYFDKLFDYLLTDDHLDTANSFVSMMNDLPKYLARRIFDAYSDRCCPFTNVSIFKETDTVFEQCMIDGLLFKIDIWCNTRTYNVHFSIYDGIDVSKLDSYNNLLDFFQQKGLSVFDGYNVKEKCEIWTHIPITTPISEIIEPILAQLQSIRDK